MSHIVRTCQKCGSHNIVGPRWNPKTDMLEYYCGVCGYVWSDEPLDAGFKRRKVNWMLHKDSLPNSHDSMYNDDGTEYYGPYGFGYHDDR